MTEDEAKTKWCPMGEKPIICDSGQRIQMNCLGSACAMWQKSGKEETGGSEQVVDAGNGRKEVRWVVNYADAGYCGLAGKP